MFASVITDTPPSLINKTNAARPSQINQPPVVRVNNNRHSNALSPPTLLPTET